jgi:hypothetical protein
MFHLRVVLLATALTLSACKLWEPSDKDPSAVRLVEITKWYEGRTSALSVTQDGRALDFRTENNWLIEHDLMIDYEVVSALYDNDAVGLDYLKNDLIDTGFGYFGHGHAHDNHDTMTYAEAYASFSTNHSRMKAYGLTPVAYAYPYGAGYKETTVKALKDAGFYAGRLSGFTSDLQFIPYIMRGERREPYDWYRLPALYMESRDFQGCENCIHDHDEFRPYVEESMRQKSWLITMYHAIGWDGETEGRPLSWGFYRRAEFYRDMEYAKALRDSGTLWLASMSDVTRYTRQRAATKAVFTKHDDDTYFLRLSHDLDSTIFDHELTVRLRVSPETVGKLLYVYPEGADAPSMIADVSSQEILVNLRPSKKPYRIDVVTAVETL